MNLPVERMFSSVFNFKLFFLCFNGLYALLGYDGIIDSKQETFVIINRGILNVRR